MFAHSRKTLLKQVLALAIGGTALFSHAQTDYPSRPVRLIVAYAPGGASDTIARAMAIKLADRWKQAVVVDNRPGGNTVIAALELTKSKPDGYSLMLALDTTLVMNQHLFRSPKYDPAKDMTPIAGVVEFPLFLVTRAESGTSTAQEYISRAKAEKGELKIGVAAVLNTIASEVFNAGAGIKTTPLHYKGTADLTLALLRGDVDYMMDVDTTAAPHIKASKMKVLATSGSKRVPTYPDVPTFKEVGLKDSELTAWFGVVGPAGMDPILVARLNKDITRAIEEPEIKAMLQEKSLFAAPTSAAALAKRIDVDSLKYGDMIRRLSLQID